MKKHRIRKEGERAIKVVGGDALVNKGYCFARAGILYVLYSNNGSGVTLDLTGENGEYEVK